MTLQLASQQHHQIFSVVERSVSK